MLDLSRILLMTDLDGTLLPASKQVPAADIAVIRRFQQSGGRFTIATGRTLEATQPYLDHIAPNGPAILYNGAMVYSAAQQTILHTTTLPAQTADVLRELMEWNPEMGVEILRADGTYVIRLNDHERRHVRTCGVTPVYCTPEEMPKDGWLKVLFALAPADVDQLEAHVNACGFDGLTFVRSADIFLEILPDGISKGSALLTHRALFARPSDVVIAAGDYHNDLTLLAAADVSVCPSNAQPVVAKRADLVLPDSCEEHAIARLLERLMHGDDMGLSLPKILD